MVYTLDTAAADRLVEAGADPELARAIVSTVSQAGESVATEADIADLRTAIADARLHIIRAVIAIAGVLFAALRLTG